MINLIKYATKIAPYINIIAKGAAAIAGIITFSMTEQPVTNTINIVKATFEDNIQEKATNIAQNVTIIRGKQIVRVAIFIFGAPFRLFYSTVYSISEALLYVMVYNPNGLIITEHSKNVLFISKDIVTGKLTFGTGPEFVLFAVALTIQISMGLMTTYITYRFVKWFLIRLLQKFGVKQIFLTSKKQQFIPET